MHILVVGLNHRSAPVELRERLAFQSERIPAAFATLRNEVGVGETVILSTCNRVEIYAAVEEPGCAIDGLHRFLSAHGAVAPSKLSGRLYTYTEPHSIHHLFAVASGLDSMVLGEGEILQQVKLAYERARACGATGKLFNALFQRALNTAKAVRTQTAIGQGSLSIGTVAVQLAEHVVPQLADASVMLLGAGKIGEVTLQHLTRRGVRHVRVMTRSFDHAVRLAAPYDASALPWQPLAPHLADIDILISATSAPGLVLSRSQAVGALHGRGERPLCLIDLGVPRNLDPDLGTLERVHLFDILTP